VVEAIKKRGATRNTLFLFSSDNGGPIALAATNGRLRAGKGTLYEGGTRVTAFATWEGRLQQGGVVNQPLHIVDWYPTLLKLAGASLNQKLEVDGLDIWPVLAEGKPSPHDAILLNTNPAGGAIRMGDWKLVVAGASSAVDEPPTPSENSRLRGRQTSIELFNLADDPFEKTNLAQQQPDKLAQLRKRLDQFARQAAPPKAAPKSPDFTVPAVWGE
jgi:arylsulfatase A-like enzyme